MLITSWTADEKTHRQIKKALYHLNSDTFLRCGRSPLQIQNSPELPLDSNLSIESKLKALEDRAKKIYHSGLSLAIGELEENNYGCVIRNGKNSFKGTTKDYRNGSIDVTPNDYLISAVKQAICVYKENIRPSNE